MTLRLFASPSPPEALPRQAAPTQVTMRIIEHLFQNSGTENSAAFHRYVLTNHQAIA